MRAWMMIAGCGVLAAACASNKPAEEPAQFPASGATTTTTTTMEREGTPDRPSSRDKQAALPPPAPYEPAAGTAHPATAQRRDGVSPGPELATVPDGARTSAAGAAPTAAPAEPRPAADNSRVNQRDRGGATLTPMDQGNSDQDVALTQQIRKAVVRDSSLSFTAKNVKIISLNGKVTLRGPVKSEREHQAVTAAALKVAGNGNVDDQIEVTK